MRNPDAGRTMASYVVSALGGLLLAAGGLHLVITPTHLAEARAQGLFMAGIGTAEILLAVLVVRNLDVRALQGAVLACGSSILLWTLAVAVGPPFGDGPEAPDLLGWITKAIELLALVAAVYLLVWRVRRTPNAPARAKAMIAVVVVASLVLGGVVYGVGKASEGITWLGQPEEHHHSEGGSGASDGGVQPTHTHGAAG